MRHPLYYYIGPEKMFSQRDPSKPELQRDLFIFGHFIQCNAPGSCALKSQCRPLEVIGYAYAFCSDLLTICHLRHDCHRRRQSRL